ncbi:MAG TPA: PD-(D/E)XK nuclease family protein [Phycisphaerae bacterium]|nr:PD-(D/E)XK nuclease family protein [Phycisphaerae bacterium]
MRLSEVVDEAAVRTEVERLVASGVLAPEDAALIAVADLAWFFATELGQRVRSAGDGYHREWMFLATAPPETFDPTVGGDDTDRVLIRGVVDGLVVMPTAIEIIDFKTDRVRPEAVADRAAEYAAQVGLYARAVREIHRRPVAATHLVFLHGRRIVTHQESDA